MWTLRAKDLTRATGQCARPLLVCDVDESRLPQRRSCQSVLLTCTCFPAVRARRQCSKWRPIGDCDGDRIEVVVGEEFFDGGVHRRDPELGRCRLSAVLHRVAECLDTQVLEEVVLGEVRQDPAERDGTHTHDADAKRPAHRVSRSAAGKSTAVNDERRSRDESGLVGGQEQDAVRHLARVGYSLKRI